MAKQSPWSLEGAAGESILGVSDTPAGAGPPRGQLVLCHGFKGYLDYGLMPVLARAGVAAGFSVHRFNFSHSGMARDTAAFARPDLFEADTWGKQQHDVAKVLDHVGASAQSTVLFGHSRGGLTALVAAATHGKRLAGVVTAAAVADASRLDPTQRRLLLKHGRLPSPSGRTGQELFIGRAWLDEIEADPEAFDPVRAAARLRPGLPVCLLHGDADTTVDVADLDRLHAARPATQAVRLAGANHVFNITNPHPAERPLDPIAQAFVDRVVDFASACVT